MLQRAEEDAGGTPAVQREEAAETAAVRRLELDHTAAVRGEEAGEMPASWLSAGSAGVSPALLMLAVLDLS